MAQMLEHLPSKCESLSSELGGGGKGNYDQLVSLGD
jgi:hypothetical protein